VLIYRSARGRVEGWKTLRCSWLELCIWLRWWLVGHVRYLVVLQISRFNIVVQYRQIRFHLRRPHRKHDRRHIIISATIAGTNADNSTASNSIIFVGVYESFSTCKQNPLETLIVLHRQMEQ
jgi:hypothetical protein